MADSLLQQTISGLTIGKTYQYSFDITNYVSTGDHAQYRIAGGVLHPITANGHYTGTFLYTGGSKVFFFNDVTGHHVTLLLDNVSVKEVCP